MRSSKEESDIEAGEGELRRGTSSLMPKGGGSSSTAEGSTGTGVAGGGDGTDSGVTTKKKKKNGCGLASPSHDNGGRKQEKGNKVSRKV